MDKHKENIKKLNIAMLGQKTVPAMDESRGGVEVVVEELSKRMVACGHHVTLYNRSGYDNGGFDEYEGVVLKNVATIKKKGFSAFTSSFVAAIKASFGPYDVIHYHAEGPCFWMPISRLFHKRCIATVHGLDWKREKWKNSVGAGLIKLGEKMSVKFADEIIVLSRNVQEYFKETYGRKTVYIPNGVNRPVKREPDEILKRFGLEKNSYILFLGRIVPEKGLEYLIKAYSQLDTQLKLVIAGGSLDTKGFEKELHNKVGDNKNIIFTGLVLDECLDELYSNAYIYVLPSDIEGMSLTLLEAMSYGNCCVVSGIAECTEVVENKAVVFKQGSVAVLTDKLQYLCDNPEIVRHYRSESADFICQKYNWDDVCMRTLELYKGQ